MLKAVQASLEERCSHICRLKWAHLSDGRVSEGRLKTSLSCTYSLSLLDERDKLYFGTKMSHKDIETSPSALNIITRSHLPPSPPTPSVWSSCGKRLEMFLNGGTVADERRGSSLLDLTDGEWDMSCTPCGFSSKSCLSNHFTLK